MPTSKRMAPIVGVADDVAIRFEVGIVVEKNDEIIFVEVRTRRSKRFGSPEESVTALKRKHLVYTT